MLRMRAILFMVLMLTTLTGCVSFNLFPNAQRKAPEDVTWMRGEVVFSDTTLRLQSAVRIDDHSFNTLNGQFNAQLQRKDEYTYDLSNVLGYETGTVKVADQGVLRLVHSPFPEWDAEYFDAMAINPRLGYTVRWENGSRIRVWVKANDIDVGTAHIGERKAWDALAMWEEKLNNAIFFVEASSEREADIVVKFQPVINNNPAIIGQCERGWDMVTSYLRYGIITVVESEITNDGVYRHEIGHCLGLNHSPDPTHNMYAYISLTNQNVTELEMYIARLLYATPIQTRAIQSPQPMQRSAALKYESDELEITSETIVTYKEW